MGNEIWTYHDVFVYGGCNAAFEWTFFRTICTEMVFRQYVCDNVFLIDTCFSQYNDILDICSGRTGLFENSLAFVLSKLDIRRHHWDDD